MAAALISYTHTETQRDKRHLTAHHVVLYLQLKVSLKPFLRERERETPLFFTYPSPGDLPLESLLRPDKGGTFVFHHLFNVSHELTHTHTHTVGHFMV